MLIPDTLQPWWQRGAALLSLAMAGVIVFLAVRHAEAIDAWAVERLKAMLTRLGIAANVWPIRLAQWLLVFVLVFGILIGGRWLAGLELTSTHLAVAVAVAFVGAFAFAGAGAGAGAALALALSGLGLIDANLGLAVALFFAVLPLVNALLDWPSWLVSRWLGRHLLGSLDGGRLRQLRNLVLHGAADLLAAALFLVALAALLPRVVGRFIDLAVVWLGLPLDIDLAAYLCSTAQDPLGAGFWASAMLFSTLLPTALHLMFLVASPFAFWLRPHGTDWQARAAYLGGHRAEPPEVDLPRHPTLREEELAKPGLNRETARKVAWWRIRQILFTYPLALVVAGLVLWALWRLIQAIAGPLPAWLLWFATFDPAFVEACLPGTF